MPVLINRDEVKEPLHLVVPLYNPFRSKARDKNAQRALKHFHDSGAVITLVEAGLSRRELTMADSGLDGTLAECKVLGSAHDFRHKYIGLHTKDELWLKENLVNVGVQHLSHTQYDWQQVCWPDADIQFIRSGWVGEAIQKLQHGTNSDSAFLQMFTQARDVGPNYEVLDDSEAPSFVQMWKTGRLDNPTDADRKHHHHNPYHHHKHHHHHGWCPVEPPWPGWPGLAWACTRGAWDAVGGLIDWAVWGGGDYDMGFALIERAAGLIHLDSHPNYQKLLGEWEDKARWGVRRNVLVMDGTVLHHWHGQKNSRKYTAKRKLMSATNFDPLRHLKRDSQGLWQMHDDGSENFIVFRDTMRAIAKIRNEDTIEVN